MENKNGLYLGGGAFICLFLFLFILDPAGNRFPDATQPVEAVIVSTKNIQLGHGSRRRPAFKHSYVFKINGNEYHGTGATSLPVPSKKIDIVYNPDDPNKNKIPKINGQRIAAWVLLGFGILFIILGRQLGKEKKLVQ